jgi:hypothetical protein
LLIERRDNDRDFHREQDTRPDAGWRRGKVAVFSPTESNLGGFNDFARPLISFD